MPFERVGDLELAQDLRFQRREWVVQRVGWAAMALLVVAALAGVLGRGGPLSEARAASPDGSLRIEYDRFAHYEAPSRLRFSIKQQPSGKEVRLWIERAYLEKARLQQVMPEPESVVLAGERVVFVFSAKEGGEVSFDLKPDVAGTIKGRAGVEGAGEASFRHFVYP